MLSRLVLLAAVLAASPAFAQRVYNLPAGQYLIAGEVRAIGPVIPPDGPVVPPVVPDDAAKMTADLIKALPASDTRHKNAIKLAGTLKLLADQAKERKLEADAIIGVYQPLMAIAVPDADWKHIHAAILAGLKSCPSPAACAATLEQYAAGAEGAYLSLVTPGMVVDPSGFESQIDLGALTVAITSQETRVDG